VTTVSGFDSTLLEYPDLVNYRTSWGMSVQFIFAGYIREKAAAKHLTKHCGYRSAIVEPIAIVGINTDYVGADQVDITATTVDGEVRLFEVKPDNWEGRLIEHSKVNYNRYGLLVVPKSLTGVTLTLYTKLRAPNQHKVLFNSTSDGKVKLWLCSRKPHSW